MAENDSGAGGQAAERVEQAIALALVGHQPLARQRLAGAIALPIARRWRNLPWPRCTARISQGRRRWPGRGPDEVTLIAVSKTQPAEAIEALIAAGQRDFGENRVQEAEAKWPALRARHPGLRLHLIGRLQSNKAEEAVELFDAIHSVDRPSLVAALAKAMDKAGRRPDCFVQVNIGDEPQKGGCPVADLPALLERRGRSADRRADVHFRPTGVEPAPYFALLAKLARRHDVAGLEHRDVGGLRERGDVRRHPCQGRDRIVRAARGREWLSIA